MQDWGVCQEKDPITHVLFLNFLPFTGCPCGQGAGPQRSLTQPNATHLPHCNKSRLDLLSLFSVLATSEAVCLDSSIDGDPTSRSGGDGICPFLTFYLETTGLQAGPPQRGCLRYPIVGLCTSGRPCVALHTRTQRQTAFGELPFLCGGTGRERRVCLVVWILLAVSPVWLLGVSVASDAINQGSKG